jgi:hypothetical protein
MRVFGSLKLFITSLSLSRIALINGDRALARRQGLCRPSHGGFDSVPWCLLADQEPHDLDRTACVGRLA